MPIDLGQSNVFIPYFRINMNGPISPRIIMKVKLDYGSFAGKDIRLKATSLISRISFYQGGLQNKNR